MAAISGEPFRGTQKRSGQKGRLRRVTGLTSSDMSAGSPEEIDEERRLLYVAMTRAKRHLHLIHPIRFYRSQQLKLADAYVFALLRGS